MRKQPLYQSAVLFAVLILLAGCATLGVPQTGATTLATATNSPAALPTVAPTAAATSTTAAQPTATSATSAAAATATAPASALATATEAVASTAVVAATAAVATTSTPAAAALAPGSVQYNIVAGKSTASYKVREQLASLNFPSDAIGKTSQISGAIVLKPDGTIDSSNSKFVVDVSTLATDSSMRDNFIGRAVLQTGQYQNATFVPKQVTGLPATLPTSGKIAFKITGDLTIRDVTKSVTWDVTGSVDNGTAIGVATTSFTFEDFNLTQPHVGMVLNIVDHIALEVDITLQKAG